MMSTCSDPLLLNFQEKQNWRTQLEASLRKILTVLGEQLVTSYPLLSRFTSKKETNTNMKEKMKLMT